MKILVSNDDGIHASGIRYLIEALKGVKDAEIYVCAPDRQRSAAGHSISTSGPPLIVQDVEIPGVVWAQSVSGTPADCVKYAMKRLRREKQITFDLVFSGINHGSNIGTDIYYSGTVSAAVEGTFNGSPAVAVSVGASKPTDDQLANCAGIIQDLCERIAPKLDKRTVLNVNFPNIPPSELKGLKVTQLGPREYDEKFDVMMNPRGEQYYWYTGELVHYEGLSGDLDVMADQDGYVSVTPLKMDMTDRSFLENLKQWELKY